MTTGNSDRPEEMGAFFDARAAGYDEHMRKTIPEFDAFYDAVAGCLPATDEALAILDLGIGTGAEVVPLLERAPNATITGIDLSAEMLTRLRSKHASRLDRLDLRQASYQDVDFGASSYDAVVSVMALHHHTESDKLALYRRIRRALRPGDRFVNGDYIVPEKEVAEHAAALRSAMGSMAGTLPEKMTEAVFAGTYHVDIPLSLDREIDLLERAGFASIAAVHRTSHAAVLVAEAADETHPTGTAG